MDTWLVAAALLSALLHAAWNAAVKANAHPAEAMTGQMVVSAILAVPLLAWAGLPAPASWPWIVLSTVLNMGSVTALLKCYKHAGFGVVYPMTRASSVLLVLPLAGAVAGEWPSALGLLGVALVSAAVMVIALGRGTARAMTRPALLWTLAAATCVAGYIVCDAQGVRVAGSTLSYGCTLGITNGILWAWLQRQTGVRLRAVVAMWPLALLLAVAAMISYLLILWVWTRAPIALGSALRDTSAIFATLFSLTFLKEPFNRSVLVAVALATAGSMLIRLG